MLLAALGIVAVALGGGSGTFASFNAQVSNQNNVFATGTLFLHGTPLGGNLCRSEDNAGNVNVSCGVALNSIKNVAGSTAYVRIQLDNAGSIDAGKLKYGVTCDDSATPTIATAAAYTGGTYDSNSPLTLTLSGLNQPLVAGTELTVGTDDLYVLATVNSGAGTVDVTGTATTTASPVAVKIAKFGSAALCDTTNGAQFFVQETTSSSYTGSTGQCVIPAVASTPCDFATPADVTTLGQAASDTTTAGGLVDLTSSLLSGQTTALDAGSSRYFLVGLKIPSGLGNTGQNSQAKFNLSWNIAQ